MKKIILSTIFCLGVWVLQGQNLIKTSTESFDKVAIDEILSKRVAVINYEAIEINTDVISNNKAILEFFGHRISVYETKLDVRGLKNYSWFAKSPDGMTSFILTVLGDDIQGLLIYNLKVYKIITLNNQYLMIEVNQSDYPNESCHSDMISKLSTHSDILSNTNNNSGDKNGEEFTCKLRLLVLYTSAANLIAGNIVNSVQAAIDETNLSFVNSLINAEVELVYLGPTDYTESISPAPKANAADNDLVRFANNNDGHMDNVHNLRAKYNADICILLFDTNLYPVGQHLGGIARGIKVSEGNAFCMVNMENITGGAFSFPHEIGHLIGCQHHPNDPTLATSGISYPFAYAHGFKSPNDDWRTIMSYDCGDANGCPRLLFWSNPNVNFGTTPMGTTITHDNARILNEKIPNVMSFLQPDNSVFITSMDVLNTNSGDVTVMNLIQNQGTVNITNTQNICFRAGNKIVLKNGFKVNREAVFKASIQSITECGQPDGEDSDYGVGGDVFENLFFENLSDIKLYPNPATEFVTIEITNIQELISSISLYDFTGRTIKRIQDTDLDIGNKVDINLEELSSGVYFISIIFKSGDKVVNKIIVN